MKYSLIDISDNIFDCGNIINDLAIDRFINNIIGDSKKSNYILNILKKPLKSKKAIIKRQQVLKDFIKNKTAFKSLLDFFDRVDNLYDNISELPKNNYSIIKNNENEEILKYSVNNTVEYALKVTYLYKKFYEILSLYSFESEIFSEIKRFLKDTIESKDFCDFENNCKSLLNLGYSNNKISLSINLNENFKIFEAEISLSENMDKPKSAFSFLKMQKPENCYDFKYDVNAEEVFRKSLINLINIIFKILKKLYDDIYGYSKEMIVFDFVFNLITVCEESKLNYCIPDIADKEEKIFEAENLYDPYLISYFYKTFKTAEKTVGNDIKLNNKGAVIVGKNKGGKTVFLRSLGASQILAQCGLIVFSKNARISIKENIITAFSKEEDNSLLKGSFESEAAYVSKEINNISQYTLVLFNEIFQTTAYDEGAAALSDLIYIFEKIKINYLIVTHIIQLIPLLNERISIYRTDNVNKYKIIQK